MNQTVKEIRSSTETTSLLDQEIEEIASEVSDLDQALALAQSEFSKEKIARDELLLQKEGEIIVQLPEIQLPEEKPIVIAAQSVWDEWRGLLF